MSVADECPLTELPAEQCACRNHRGGVAPGEEPIETIGQPFAASYDGECGRGCHRGIKAGDEIARAADRELGYVHAGRCP